MLKAEAKTKIIIILVVILIGKRGIAKKVSEVILKGKRESLIKINLGKMKIMRERELEVAKNAGSAGKRSISGRIKGVVEGEPGWN